jgi:hypothetical protein
MIVHDNVETVVVVYVEQCVIKNRANTGGIPVDDLHGYVRKLPRWFIRENGVRYQHDQQQKAQLVHAHTLRLPPRLLKD